MHVLVADDDPAILEILTEYLQQQGMTVFSASDGQQASDIIDAEPIRIAVLDWFMPGINGIELSRKIREMQDERYVYIIMLTGKESDDLLSVFDAGIDEFSLKPINLRDFHARIKVGMRVVELEDAAAELHRQLKEANHMKNKFIGLAAHDLRNPMISIRGFSELLLKEKADLSEEQTEFITIIHNTSDNMLALLNDLLDLSQIESGKLVIKRKPGSLRKLIEERIQLHRLQADKKRITIHTDFKKLPEFKFDEQRLSQAVDNLLTNAIKFSPPGTNVYLSLKKENDNAVFSVRDEGPGIPTEEHSLMFNEFQRLSIRPTAGEASTGLGLAITKKIVEAHGGEIDFETRVGRGTSFAMHLPMSTDI